MEFMQKLSEAQKIVKSGDYKVLPVSCEILSDFTTPIETIPLSDMNPKWKSSV